MGILPKKIAVRHTADTIIGFAQNEFPHETGSVKVEIAIVEDNIHSVPFIGTTDGRMSEKRICLISRRAGKHAYPYPITCKRSLKKQTKNL